MTTQLRATLARLLAALTLGAAFTMPNSAQTVTVYDNSTTAVNPLVYSQLLGATEIGDVITLAGTARLLTDVTVQFYNQSNNAGSFNAQISFYNYSGGPSVGSLLGSFATTGSGISALSSQNVTFAGLNLTVPDQLAFAVSVSNFGTLDLGLVAFDPPGLGSSNSSSVLLNNFNNAPPGLLETSITAGFGNLFFVAKASSS